jgi:hypothetical protein
VHLNTVLWLPALTSSIDALQKILIFLWHNFNWEAASYSSIQINKFWNKKSKKNKHYPFAWYFSKKSVPSESYSQVGNIFVHLTYLNNFLCTKSKQSRYTVSFLHLQGILLLTQAAASNVSNACRRLLQETSTPFRVHVRPSVRTVPVFGLRDGPFGVLWRSINGAQQNLHRLCLNILIFYEVTMCVF